MFQIKADIIIPDLKEVLLLLGYQNLNQVLTGIRDVFNQACQIFSEQASPKGMILEVTFPQFEDIYRGEGKNSPNTPIDLITPKASHVALFAFTQGVEISQRIKNLFQSEDYVLATLLDAVASSATDKASAHFESLHCNTLKKKYNVNPNFQVLLYSPGYCGWHISGQKKLFEYLKPEKIGIRLNESFLMTPLKSLSGVLVGGNRSIHLFNNNYPFCKYCHGQSCIKRQKMIF